MNYKTDFEIAYERQLASDQKKQVLKICSKLIEISVQIKKLHEEIENNPLIDKLEKGRFFYYEKKMKDLASDIIVNCDKSLMG